MVVWPLPISCLLTDDVEQQMDHAQDDTNEFHKGTPAEVVNQFKSQIGTGIEMDRATICS